MRFLANMQRACKLSYAIYRPTKVFNFTIDYHIPNRSYISKSTSNSKFGKGKKSGKKVKRPVDRWKRGSSSKKKLNRSGSTISPVALISDKDTTAKVALIPINLFEGDQSDGEAFREALAILAMLNKNRQQVELFMESCNNLKQGCGLIRGDSYVRRELDRETLENEQPSFVIQNKATGQAFGDKRVQKYVLPSRMIDELNRVSVAGMQLNFEMNMTNLRDAILNPGKIQTIQDKLVPDMDDSTLALSTNIHMHPEKGKTVPLQLNALIHGTVSIDPTKFSKEKLGRLQIPQFNEYVTAVAANLCSKALQKGFPMNVSRNMYTTDSYDGRDKSKEHKLENMAADEAAQDEDQHSAESVNRDSRFDPSELRRISAAQAVALDEEAGKKNEEIKPAVELDNGAGRSNDDVEQRNVQELAAESRERSAKATHKVFEAETNEAAEEGRIEMKEGSREEEGIRTEVRETEEVSERLGDSAEERKEMSVSSVEADITLESGETDDTFMLNRRVDRSEDNIDREELENAEAEAVRLENSINASAEAERVLVSSETHKEGDIRERLPSNHWKTQSRAAGRDATHENETIEEYSGINEDDAESNELKHQSTQLQATDKNTPPFHKSVEEFQTNPAAVGNNPHASEEIIDIVEIPENKLSIADHEQLTPSSVQSEIDKSEIARQIELAKSLDEDLELSKYNNETSEFPKNSEESRKLRYIERWRNPNVFDFDKTIRTSDNDHKNPKRGDDSPFSTEIEFAEKEDLPKKYNYFADDTLKTFKGRPSSSAIELSSAAAIPGKGKEDSESPAKKRDPHIVCVREGKKGCTSPGLADNAPYVAKKSLPKDTGAKRSSVSLNLLECGLYQKSQKEASSKKKMMKSTQRSSSSSSNCKSGSTQKKGSTCTSTPPCQNKSERQKLPPVANKSPKCESKCGDTSKSKDPCKKSSSSSSKSMSGSSQKKGSTCKSTPPCQNKSEKQKLPPVKKKSTKTESKCGDTSKSKDPCKRSSSTSAADKNKRSASSSSKSNDPCKGSSSKKSDSSDSCQRASCRSPAKKRSASDPCKVSSKKKTKSKDPCKRSPSSSSKKSDPCKRSKSKDPCERSSWSSSKKSDPCKRSKSKDPCKRSPSSSSKKSDPCKKSKSKDPCKRSPSSSSKKSDPCKRSKSQDPCKKSSSSSSKKSDPCKRSKSKDPCKRSPSSSSKKSDPCKRSKSKDPCKRSPSSSSKKSDPCKKSKSKNPCKKSSSSSSKSDPCKRSSPSSSKKPDPCKRSLSTLPSRSLSESEFKRKYHSLASFAPLNLSLHKQISELVMSFSDNCASKKGKTNYLPRDPLTNDLRKATCAKFSWRDDRKRRKLQKRKKNCYPNETMGMCPDTTCYKSYLQYEADQRKERKKRRAERRQKISEGKSKCDQTKYEFTGFIVSKEEENEKVFRSRLLTPVKCVYQQKRSYSSEGVTNREAAIMSPFKICERKASIEPVKENDVGICVDCVALSDSDLHIFESGGKKYPGLTLGNEASGVVEKVGKNVKKLKPGDHVAIECGLPCGRCTLCRSGRYNLCHHLTFKGCLKKYCTHPASFCHKISERVPLSYAAMAYQLSLGCNACVQARVRPNSNVAVIGSCAMTVCTAMCAKAMGCANICVICHTENAHDIVLENVTEKVECFDSRTTEKEIYRKICDSLCTNPDIVINCLCSTKTMNASIMALKSAGICVISGFLSECAAYNVMDALMKEIQIKTSFRSKNMFPFAVDLLERKQVHIACLIADCLEWDKLQVGFEKALHESNCGPRKIVVQCRSDDDVVGDKKN